MKKLTAEEFIIKAIKVHNNNFIYNKVKYINSRTKVTITCPIHGDFEQLPSGHLNGYGCPGCSGRFPLSSNEFQIKLFSIFPNLKLISCYKNSYTKIRVIDDLTIIYTVLPNDLLQGHPPSIQSAVNKNKAFEILAKQVHGNKYDYSEVNYTCNRNKIIIICKEHGIFKQIPYNHLKGAGCRKCDGGGWSKTRWINLCINYKNKEPKVYIIRCYNNNENFIKIGITTTSVFERFPNKKVLPYDFEILYQILGSPDFVWDKEKELQRQFKNYQYIPKPFFNGNTECFTNDILKSFT